MEQLTLKEAIDKHYNECNGTTALKTLRKVSFEAGAEWQKEQDKMLLDTLIEIGKCLANAEERQYERKLIQTAINHATK